MIRVRAKTIGDQSWQPKTRVNRAARISAALRSYLNKYMPLGCDAGWYFPSPQGHRWDCDNFSRDLRGAQDKAGLQWTCLDYRHTFGNQLSQNGERLYKLATLLGNSPEICRRLYAALVPEAMITTVAFGITFKSRHNSANANL